MPRMSRFLGAVDKNMVLCPSAPGDQMTFEFIWSRKHPGVQELEAQLLVLPAPLGVQCAFFVDLVNSFCFRGMPQIQEAVRCAI